MDYGNTPNTAMHHAAAQLSGGVTMPNKERITEVMGETLKHLTELNGRLSGLANSMGGPVPVSEPAGGKLAGPPTLLELAFTLRSLVIDAARTTQRIESAL